MVKPLISIRNIVVLDENSPHIRKYLIWINDQVGREQWSVHNGQWVCLDEAGRVKVEKQRSVKLKRFKQQN